MPPKRFAFIAGLTLCLTLACVSPIFTGCNAIRPAAVAPGQDAVVVNAQRILESSLSVYQQVTEWELQNRATLPVSVSRAVDKYRPDENNPDKPDFPKQWRLVRKSLKDYKENKGLDPTPLSKLTAALSVVQSALLGLQLGNGGADVIRANQALTSLINSVTQLTRKQPLPPPVPQQPDGAIPPPR